MAIWYGITTILIFLSSESVLASSCPTWFYYNNATHQCECGELLDGMVHCNQQKLIAEIQDGFCATSTQQEGQYYAGYCPFRHTENNTNRMFSEMPSDPDLLNDAMCGPYNRKGLLCGKCIDGYGPAVYSLSMKCANCSTISTGSAISLYLFLELIPITLFFVCVVFFRLNITSGPLLGYVYFCQSYIYSVEEYLYICGYTVTHISSLLRMLLYSSMTLCGSLVLQVFKFVVPPFCISGKLTAIHIHMLSSVTTIYPIVLVIFTCIFMELHARNYRILHIIWKPFSIILNKLNIASVTNDAIIHALATFILLSASSLTFNVSSLFTMSPVYHSRNGTKYKTILFSDPTIVWFSHKHIFYVMIALVPFIFLTLIPSLLLCVYPTRLYKYISRFLKVRKRLAITAFAEALHNCFKDGLNGTRDYRALAGWFMLAGIQRPITCNLVKKGYGSQYTNGFLFICLSLVVSYLRPCKSGIANFSLSYHFMVSGILTIAVGLWNNDLSTRTDMLEGMFIIIPVISHILVLIWAVSALAHRIMKHFGYQFNPYGCKVALTDLVNAIYFCRGRCGYKRRGYQILLNVQ